MWGTSKMKPTDRDLLLMNQLAYHSPSSIDRNGMTVTQLAQRVIDDLNNELMHLDKNSKDYKLKQEELKLMQEIVNNPKYASWTIDGTTNQNGTNGLRAIAIGTGDGHGIVAFAGTEGMFKVGEDQTDNVDNVNMARKDPTPQQMAALKFLEDMSSAYTSFDVTGHSKGGNNAIFAALMISEEIARKIHRVVTYNSPGFSREVLNGFKNLSILDGKVTQYRTTGDVVPALLMNDIGEITYVESTIDGLTDSHYLHTFIFDESGAVVPSTDGPAWYIGIIRTFTTGLQDLPERAVEWITNVVSFFIKNQAAVERIIPTLIMMAGALFVLNPALVIALVKFLAILVVAIVVLALIAFIITEGLELFKKLFQEFKNKAKAAAVAIVDFYERAKTWLDNFFKKMWEGIKNLFNQGKSNAVKAVKYNAEALDKLKKKVASIASDYWNKVRNSIAKVHAPIFKSTAVIFGSNAGLLSAVGQINVTISRIDDMQRRLSVLRTRYLDSKLATNSARAVVSKVSSHYNKPGESYVRNCCRDIDAELKNAQNFIDAAERSLNKRRQVLVSAIDIFRQADQTARTKVRTAARSFA